MLAWRYRLPERRLRDWRTGCCLTILVSGSAGGGGSASVRPLTSLRSPPPLPFDPALAPLPLAGFAGGWAGFAEPFPG